MVRQLTWTLSAALVFSACGAGDRGAERDLNLIETTMQPAAVPDTAAAAQPAGAESEVGGEAEELVHPAERLYTVQIAAYLSADSAQALAAKLGELGFPAWTMEVRVGGETHYRTRVGAHPRLGEMRGLGAQISSRFEQQVWVAPIDMSTPIPVSIVADTRALLAAQ